jgi:protein-S-isoprenylcysteine O-methyltransferase Ste14
VAVLFAAQYRAIIAAEEQFLRARFGAPFEEYRARVPRFLPRLRANGAGSGPWSWRRALRKEHNPLAAWAALVVLLLASDQTVRARAAGSPATLRGYGLVPYAALLLGIIAGWLAVKGWKHRWARGGFTEDLRRRLRETAR